jgi:hypothetical protein
VSKILHSSRMGTHCKFYSACSTCRIELCPVHLDLCVAKPPVTLYANSDNFLRRDRIQLSSARSQKKRSNLPWSLLCLVRLRFPCPFDHNPGWTHQWGPYTSSWLGCCRTEYLIIPLLPGYLEGTSLLTVRV